MSDCHSTTQSKSKPCTKCGILKPLSEFHAQRRTRDGRCEQCRACMAEDKRRFYAKPEARAKLKATEFRSKLRYRYGLLEEEYDSLLAAQGGKCAICIKPPGDTPKTKRLHVDHDHGTGRIRGLICLKCNSALAQFGDSLEGVMRAVEYLKQSPA